MKNNILPAIRLTAILMLVCSGFYTIAVWGVAQAMPNSGKGFVTQHAGKSYYSNIGQSFTADNYFNSRPSAVTYNAAGSCGSNKGPSNPDYLAGVQARIDSFLVHNPGTTAAQIPADLITMSASGLDPHISLQGAEVQVARIARARNISEDKLKALIAANTQKPLLHAFGPTTVNVLQLNIALDNLK
jgi:K+-transporting ATPase ATPase C chain